jgi:arginine-tRNA-protein transferase
MRKVPFLDVDTIEFTTKEMPCVYLDNKIMRMRYRYIRDSTKDLNSKLIHEGWRRFGLYYSKPDCFECNECQSLRIDAERFLYGRSARRVFKKNAKTKIVKKAPSVDDLRLNLYIKYHKHMQKKRGWDYYEIDKRSYEDLYIKGDFKFAKEITYYIEDRLVGVDLIDILDDGISSVYFYYDPDFSSHSLGRYSIYRQIEMAKQMGLRWVYLGYYVKNSRSLSYKDNFKPNQKLRIKEGFYWA